MASSSCLLSQLLQPRNTQAQPAEGDQWERSLRGAFSRSATRVGSKTRVLMDSLNAVDTVSTNKGMLFWEVGSGRSLTRSLIFESISVVIFGVEDDLSGILTTREMVRDCTNLNSNFVFDFSGLILFYLIHFYLYRSLQFLYAESSHLDSLKL